MYKNFIKLYLIILLPAVVACKGENKDAVYDNLMPGRIIDTTDTITMDKFIGINGFVDDPIDKLQAVGFVREYHNWSWDEGNGDIQYPGFPNNKIQFAPSGPGWSYDDYYGKLKDKHIAICPCIQGSVSWLHGKNNYPFDYKPIDFEGANPESAQSYYKKSNFMFQFAARYGTAKIPIENLKLADNQQKISGLGLIKYIEDWNEQDKKWKGDDAYFSPEAYAAMASADYDAHCNTLKRIPGNYGIKNADSSMKLVMGGLSSLNLDYIKRMQKWFEQNRKDKKFAVDVINFHIYAFKNGGNWGASGPAVSPEEAHFREKLSEIVKFRNEYLPNVEVWISEFGWDTNPQSPLCAQPIGPFDIQDMQGIWIVRAYLAFAAAGVDRAQLYMSRDVNPNDATWFATCGIMGQKGDFTPKKSWYYVYTLKNILMNKRYAGQMQSPDPNILIYKFQNIANKDITYAVWAKTSKNYTVENFSLSVPSSKQITQINLTPGSTTGQTSILTVRNGQVNIHVSEKPVFINYKN